MGKHKIPQHKIDFSDQIRAKYGNTVSRTQVLEFISANPSHPMPNWLFNDVSLRGTERGTYNIPDFNNQTNNSNSILSENVSPSNSDSLTTLDFAMNTNTNDSVLADVSPSANSTLLAFAGGVESLVPKKSKIYIPFGNHDDLRKIIAAKRFYPVFITGLSGNGKTTTVEQTCAEEDRECIRVNITIETDESDLIGSFSLVDGNTQWVDGPVIVAMKRGAVLLLDEIDLASTKIMCLQPILEGKGIFVKKTNTFVPPHPTFTVVATANTKGQGSEDGKFIGTNVLNEAFLDRFPITMEQFYPPVVTETKILTSLMESLKCKVDTHFANVLVAWANLTREAHKKGSCTEIISTRRLIYIVGAWAIFGDRFKAVQMNLERFTEEHRTGFLTSYKALDDTINPDAKVIDMTKKAPPKTEEVEFADNTCPF